MLLYFTINWEESQKTTVFTHPFHHFLPIFEVIFPHVVKITEKTKRLAQYIVLIFLLLLCVHT